jgi:hypothetical protein
MYLRQVFYLSEASSPIHDPLFPPPPPLTHCVVCNVYAEYFFTQGRGGRANWKR